MTVPEENRPKTKTTDGLVGQPAEKRPEDEEQGGGTGRSMQEALEEAGVTPEDFQE